MNAQNDISKGHDIVQNDISKNNQSNIGFLKSPLEKTLVVSAKKIEKIVTAIYLVTDVMDANVPLTTSLRTQSMTLLSAVYGILTSAKNPTREAVIAFASQIDHVASLVTIGSVTRQISPMNANILSTELTKASELVHSEIKELTIKQQPVILDELLRERSFDDAIAQLKSKRHQQSIKTTLLGQKDIINDIKKVKATFQKDIPKKTLILDRKTEILNVIKSRTNSTINDIKSMITKCSDKTIQREVNGLVEMGLVKKEGNKRWTTYRAI